MRSLAFALDEGIAADDVARQLSAPRSIRCASTTPSAELLNRPGF